MHFVRYLLPFFLTILLCTSVQSESLNIGIRNDVYDPMMLKAAERLKKAAESVGYKIIYHYSPAKRSLKLAEEGYLDGEFYRHPIIEASNPNLVRINVSLGQFDYYVWILEDKTCVKDLQELSYLKPVGTRGVVFFDTQVYPMSKVGNEEVNTMPQVLEILKRGRADYTVHSKLVIDLYANQTGIKLKQCLEEPLFSMKFYLYLHKSKRVVIPYLEKALKDNNTIPHK